MAAILALIAAVVPRHIPQATPVSSIARILDSLAPWLLGCVIILVLVLAVLRAHKHAAAFLILVLAAGTHLYLDHRAVSLPSRPDANPELRVLFFNVFNENVSHADRIATAVMEADPDVIAFGEGDGMYPALRRLDAQYQRLSYCDFEDCQLLIYTKQKPKRAWTLNLNVFADGRYAVIEVSSNSERPRFVVFNHLVKPWMEGVTESELQKLAAQYDWLAGDVVALGDFNAAPWAFHINELLRKTGFRAQRHPIGTWPASFGSFGVPIDQVLVHGHARIVRAVPFGADLGSNHLGLLVAVAFPDTP